MKSITCPRCYTIFSMTWAVHLPGGLCQYCNFDLGIYYRQVLAIRLTDHGEIFEILEAQLMELFELG